MAQKINIATIDIDVNDFINSATKAKKEIEFLTQENKKLKNSTEDNTQAIVNNEIELKRQREAYNQSIKAAKGLQVATQELDEAIQTEGKSVQQVTQDRVKLINLSKNIKGNTEQEIQLRNRLNTAIDNQTQFIRENSSNYSGAKDSIGEYKNALSTLSPTLGGIFNTLTEVRDQLIAQKGALTTLTGTTNVSSKALKFFRLALINTGIGAIILLLGSFITFLNKTQAGIDLVSKATAGLRAAFDVITDRLSKLGGALVKIVSGDFAGAFDDIKDSAKGLGDELSREVRLAVELEAELQKLKKQQISVNVARSETNKLVKEQNKIAEDVTKSLQQRSVAINKAISLEEKQISTENRLANDQLKNALQLDGSFESNKAKIKEIKQAFINSQNDAKLFQETLLNIGISETTVEDVEVIAQAIIDNNAKIEASEEKLTTLGNKRNIIENEAAAKREKQVADANARRLKSIEDQAKKEEERFNNNQRRLSEELDLFLAQQDFKAKTLQEELELFKQVSERKKEILKDQLANNKISEENYQAQILELGKETAMKQAEIVVEAAFQQAEFQRTQIENEIISQQDKNNRLLEVQREYEAKRLEQGIISQTEFNLAIDTLNEENRLVNAELEAERLELDRENKLESEAVSFEEEQERRRGELAERRELELRNAIRLGADTGLVKDKFNKLELDLERELAEQKFTLAENSLNSLTETLGKNSKAGKAAAIAAALINTYQGITAELSTKTVTPFEFGAKLANIAATTSIGFKAVKNITSTKTPKAEKGMLVGGLPHSQGGTMIEAERGEAIINANSVSKFKPLLSSINQSGGGVSFGATSSTQNDLINYDKLSRSFESAINNMPSPKVSVTEINEVNNNYTKVLERASI